MPGLAIAVLSLVTLQRLGELWLAARNTRRLLAGGGREAGAGHYPLIVALHAAWLAALWWLAPGRPVGLPVLAIFVLLQLARVWSIASLGPRWTTRIIVMPGARLIRRGPYRVLNHPNYAIVAAEIAILPLAFGLWPVALAFSLLNAGVLAIRIRAENAALAAAQGGQ